MQRWHSSNDWWHKGLIKCSSLTMKACGNTWKAVAFSQLPSPSYHFQALRMSGLINKLCLIFSVTTGCTMKSSPNMGTPRILQQSQDMTLFCRSWAKACAAVALKATGQENRCPCQGKWEWDLGMLIQLDMGMEIPTVEIPSPQHRPTSRGSGSDVCDRRSSDCIGAGRHPVIQTYKLLIHAYPICN